MSRAAYAMLVSALLLAAPPARAAGAFAWPAGGLFDAGEDGVRGISAVRALIIEDGDAHVIALQASAELVGGGAAWLVPLPGAPARAPAALDPDDLEPLLRASDPLYPIDASCGAGCAGACENAQTFDSGALIDVRTFGAQTAAGNRAWFAPAFVPDLIDELAWNGIAVDAALRAALMDYAERGWGVLVVQLEGSAWEATATPLVAIRMEGAEPVLPMLLTGRTAADTVHALVMTAAPYPTRPTGAPITTPTLGEALYDLEWTPAFYEARLQVAIEEAGGEAWVLEYSGSGAALVERQPDRLLDRVVLFGDDTAAVQPDPFPLIDAMAAHGLLSARLDPSTLCFTRWRTYLPVSALRDQPFGPAPGLADYEVRLTREDYNGRVQLLWPLLVGAAALRRRRRAGPR